MDEEHAIDFKQGLSHIENTNKDMYQFLVKSHIIINESDEEHLLQRNIKAYCDLLFYRVVFFTSLGCNLRCDYCYENHVGHPLKDNVYNMILDYWKDKHGCFGIDWFGGEPLLCLSQITKFMSIFKKQHPNDNLVSAMTTNGTLLTKKVFESCLSLGIKNYQITLDGLRQTHDIHRHFRNGSGSFNSIIENIKSIKLLSDEFNIIIRTNIDKSTDVEAFLSEISPLVANDKRFSVLLFPIADWGKMDKELKEKLYDKTEFVKYENEIMSKHPTIRNYQFEQMIHGSMICGFKRPNIFVVNPEGKVVDCTIEYEKNIYGTVANLEEIARNRSKKPLCDKTSCPLYPVCFGNCCHMGQNQCESHINEQKQLLAYEILRRKQ